jgi:nucleoside-diphosphate-sugar epimerase
MSTVLVTGGTGFLGSHAVADLLKRGFKVRTTVRDPSRRSTLLSMLECAGVSNHESLDIRVADLGHDEGWADAVAGCEFVLHMASPFPAQPPKDEQDLIRPARDGTLRVLRSAQASGVRRVVMTSSFAAVGYGHAPRSGGVFTESDWTNLDAPVPAYIKSKTLAEQAAWRFAREEGRTLELSVINPTGIFGPVLGPDYSSSIALIKQMLDGKLPGAPRIYFGVVDVRDVVEIHKLAMTHPAAAGERFIAVAGAPMSLLQVARALRTQLGSAANKAPNRELPDWLIRLLALFSPNARRVVPDLGKIRAASNQKAKALLGWSPRSGETAVVASGESLLRLSA